VDGKPVRPRRRIRFPRWLHVSLGALIAAAALYFLANRLVRDWHQIPWSDINLNVPLLIASFGVLLLIYIPLFGFTWTVVLRTMGERIRLLDAISIITVSQLGKYVPGKVWFTLGRVYLARRHGIPESKTAVSAFMETGFALLAALMLFAVSLLLVPRGEIPVAAYWAFVLVPLCLLVLHPRVLTPLVNFLLRRLKQPAIDIRLPFGRALGILGLYLAMWTAQGIGCYLLVNSFYPLTVDKLFIIVGGYALAWILGFLSLVTPAGLGIREGILTLAFGFAMPESVAILAALLARVWVTVAEALAAAVMVVFLRRRRR
jgi:uncharacterized membrane protein YbhN (UPF0104 family)